MGNLRNAGNDFPLPTRLMEQNDPTSEVDRIIAKYQERIAADNMQRLRSQQQVGDWRNRFRED